ncbi:hypothetical protein [Streptomyces sp. NPDC047043]|uniref:hypothetical protein n=1 Tax=Streptomyces sp. NPDC047043 TaxID=3154497 RepID=UPI003403DDD4
MSALEDPGWDDLGTPHLDEATAARLVENLSSTADPRDIRALAAKRDALLTAVVAATHGHGASH